jgi:hypothetical protein
MAGQLRVDEITDEAGTGSPSFPQGIAPSSLGTGTPDATNFLRGDGAWEIVDVEGEIADFAAGEPGQPRLVGNAVSVFPGTYPVLTVTASDAVSVANGLTTIRSSGSVSGSTFVDGIEHVTTLYAGVIRFRGSTERVIGTGDSNYEIQVLKNGVLATTFTGIVTQATGGQSHTAEITVAANDTILWQIRRTSGGFTIALNNGTNTASNGYVSRGLFAPAV